MLIEKDLETFAPFLVPGGKKDKVVYYLVVASSSEESSDLKSFSKAKRAWDGLYKGTRNLRDGSFEETLRIFAKDVGEDVSKIDEVLDRFRKCSKFHEGTADSELDISKYPMGIFGFVSAEILPILEELPLFKPTLDHEIDLTVAFQRARLPSNRIAALARSDMAESITGQALLQAYASANSEFSSDVYLYGLYMLTGFQFLSALTLGENLEDSELATIASLAIAKPGQKSSVDAWFHRLKSLTGCETWERIYRSLAETRGMDFDWSSKTGVGKLRKIRQGITPLPFDQSAQLLASFSDELRHNTSTMVLLQSAYWFSVMADNFQRHWEQGISNSHLLPGLDLADALQIGYTRLHQRNRGQ